MLKLDYSNAMSFLQESELDRLEPQVALAHQMLHARSGPGSGYLGWLDLPVRISHAELDRIRHAAHRIRESSEVLVVIGIGGSYLGARAAVEMLSPAFSAEKGATARKAPQIVFCGQNLSAAYMADLMAWLQGREVS